MLRFVFLAVLLIFVVRAVGRFWGGLVEGLSGQPSGRGGVPARGVQMVRDPVCGTFIVPDNAISLSVGRQQLYFCSVNCRDKYRSRTA